MTEIATIIKKFIRERFSLEEDKADEAQIIDSVDRNLHFKGTNLWSLIFAILIACIGLNLNSSVVIIGAMLISPLMGPIMGIGLGIGILDFDMMKRGIKNLLIAAVFSIITSFLYFYISPLHGANSELLARTTPSIWDVLIAFFGGMAGIIAGTRKEKSNVLPGVAIATTLLPPLCTAGFGLATGEYYYTLGALYLFFINGLFICIATFIIVRYLNFARRQFPSPTMQRRMVRYIWAIVLLTIIPSIFLAVRIVQKTIFEENARRFVQQEFRFPNTQVVHQSFKYDSKPPLIDLLVIGQELEDSTIRRLKGSMRNYRLDSSSLVLHQGLNARNEIDLAQVKASILEDVFKTSTIRDTTSKPPAMRQDPLPDLTAEIQSLYPEIRKFTLVDVQRIDAGTRQMDTVTVFIASVNKKNPMAEMKQLKTWLKARIKRDSVEIFVNSESAKIR